MLSENTSVTIKRQKHLVVPSEHSLGIIAKILLDLLSPISGMIRVFHFICDNTPL